MTDDLATYGLGALPDPPDQRDYPVSALYLADGLTPTPDAALPSSFVAGGMPPVLDQGSTPMCVAYSSSSMKAWQDRRDQERFFDFDEPTFFREIGGTSAGAYVRAAMDRMRLVGYPVKAADPDRDQHKIAAYFAVPTTYADVRSAIFDLGPIVVSTTWYHSWFRPSSAGVLPAADTPVGGHAIVAYGWDAKGLRLRNSWGADWGVSGDCWMAPYQVERLNGAWKAIDAIEHPIPYAHVVRILARPSLRVRSKPSTSAPTQGASIPYGRDVTVDLLEKYGGKYLANGVYRTDWLRVKGRGWIARGYTRLIR